MIYLRLAWEFFKTGLFFRGRRSGYPAFLYAMSAKTGWFTATDISNMIAISEFTWGPWALIWRPTWDFTSSALSAPLAPLFAGAPVHHCHHYRGQNFDAFKEPSWCLTFSPVCALLPQP